MQLTRTRRCPGCGRDVSTKLTRCPRCGTERSRTQEAPRTRAPADSPLFRPEPDRTWGPEAYLGYGAVLTAVVVVIFILGLGLGPIELLLITPLSLLAMVWLAIGIIAKGVEVGRRSSQDG